MGIPEPFGISAKMTAKTKNTKVSHPITRKLRVVSVWLGRFMVRRLIQHSQYDAIIAEFIFLNTCILWEATHILLNYAFIAQIDGVLILTPAEYALV